VIRYLAVLAALPCLAAGPQPPCGVAPHPDFAPLGQPPAIKTWDRAELGAAWTPPACLGWTQPGLTTMVAIAARVRATDLLQRVGSITTLKGVEYWSTTHQRWQALILEAHPLTSASSGSRRTDFAASELAPQARLYFEQEDSLSGKGIYEIHILESTPDRLVFETRNITTLHYFMVPIFHPGDVESIYFLERESKDVWRYYNLARIGEHASPLAAGHPASAVNRAVALYRHLVGIPTNQDPPAAK
jgi:hypothetical protein